MTLLELKNVSVHYGRIQAISDMSFSVEEGEIVSLIGSTQYLWALGATGLHLAGSLAMTALGIMTLNVLTRS